MSWLSEHRLVIILVLMVLGALFSVGSAFWLAFDSSKKSEKIASLNEQIAGSVTGGNSFCYLFPIIDDLGKVEFYLNHEGKYPVFDVTIRVLDETKLESTDWGGLFEKHFGYRNKILTQDELKEYYSDDNIQDRALKNEQMRKDVNKMHKECTFLKEYIGTVNKNMPNDQILYYILPSSANIQKFDVHIIARNGFFRQRIEFKRFNNYWLYRSKVLKRLPNEKEEILRKYESSRKVFNENGESTIVYFKY